MNQVAVSDFGSAIKELNRERRREQQRHVALDELTAYQRGVLPSDQHESIAEHLVVCEDCSRLLLSGVVALAGSGNDGADFETEIDEAWSRLLPSLRHGNGVCRGTVLTSLLKEGALPVEEALPIGIQVSRALVDLHAKGRVLSDLRAENVLVEPDGQIKVLDLGMVPTAESLEIDSGQVGENAVARMYLALSPEQVAREGFSRQSNLFSFGVLLYEMLTGESPFQDSTPLGTVCRILSLDPLPANELNLAVTPALAALIDRLLAKEPEDRPQSAASVVSELEAFTNGSVLTSTSRELVEPRPIEEQIEGLYDEIIALTRATPADEVSCNEEIGRMWARLQELQQTEAEQFRGRFEASLNMPLDAGQKILDRAAELQNEVVSLISEKNTEREDLEDPAAADPAAEEADVASAPTQTY